MSCFFSLSKSRGGGPAPLFLNPSVSSFRIVSISHAGLALVTMTAVVIPRLFDLGCANANMFNYTMVVLGLSIAACIYFSMVSLRELGSESEWGVRVAVMTGLVCVSIGAVGWGMFLWYRDVLVLRGDEAGCASRVTFALNCSVIVFHVLCMAYCVLASFRIVGSIITQFAEWQYIK